MTEHYDGAFEIERAWREGLTPDPILTVSEWADQHRVLSSLAASEPGRWRTHRTPYLRDIMDCLSPTSAVERVVFMKGAQIGAPLAIETPIPTPNGWKRMADIEPGDQVFDEQGQPAWVIGVSPVFTDRQCYEVVFSDRTRIVCDASHLWTVSDERNHRHVRQRTLTTRDIAETFSGQGNRHRYAIDLTGPLALPEQALPLHPYLLGMWLGNGNRGMNRISVHEDDGAEIAARLQSFGVHAEFVLPSYRKGRTGEIVIDPGIGKAGRCPTSGRMTKPTGRANFTQTLVSLGLHKNKFIPPIYLRASIDQRLELLRGLMDSDGHVTTRGRCEYSTVLPTLWVGVQDLLFGLGLKPTVYPYAAATRIIQGQPVKTKNGWRLSFTSYSDRPVFSLARKVDRLLNREQGRPSETERRRIVDVRPVVSVPVRCIEVLSPNHLFLAGWQMVPTHNTEAGSNWIGYVIHHAPGPMMAVWPTVEMAKRNSKIRIDPLIEESEVLNERIAPPRSRDSGNTILAKEFRGGVLVMTGANSAVGLRSMPVRYLFLDEVDGYPPDVEGEGDAISLAEARTRTFARRKIFIVSTPTLAGASAIEREYEASDQRRYFVPCPHCQHYQWLRFEQLRWEKSQPETAAYLCESCEQPIQEHHKTNLLEKGEWRATRPEASGRTAGFHLSSLYSPVGWRSWSAIAADWESACDKQSGSLSAIKTFKNTELGETWVEEGEAPDWQRLMERREDYRIGTIPPGGLLLVGGADIQKDRIEVSIWAFGRGLESWLVEHRVLMGDTARETVWSELRQLIGETWTHISGAGVPLQRIGIDTGFATQETYAFIRSLKDSRVMGMKGQGHGAALIGTPTKLDVSRQGKRLRRGIQVFPVAVGIAKLEFYNHLGKLPGVAEDGITPVYPAGYVHLPRMDAEYLQQLCAEQLVTHRDRRGYAKREWQKLRDRNEALDCYVYARAAAAAAGLDRFEERHWQRLESTLGIEPPSSANPRPPPNNADTPNDTIEATHRGGLVVSGAPSTPPGRRVIKSRWLNR